MAIIAPFQIRQKSISKTTVKCAKGGSDSDYLSSCTIVDCELLLVDTCTGFVDCTFENCRIVAQQEIAGYWMNCRWKGCTFIGDYSQGTYGGRNADCTLPEGPMVLDCDFAQANLSDLALYAADLKTIRFPRWPNVTFLEPFGQKAELRSLPLPKEFAKWWFYFSGSIHKTHSSLSFNWDMVEAMLRKWKTPIDIEPEKDEVQSILGLK